MTNKASETAHSNNTFVHFASKIAEASGRPKTFLIAAGIIIVWAITGPFFDYSDTWQLVINTGTSLITFLMVFLIQNTQNRDTVALQLKLDELILVTKGARKTLLDLEELSDEELQKFHRHYEEMATNARDRIEKNKAKKNHKAPDTPEA